MIYLRVDNNNKVEEIFFQPYHETYGTHKTEEEMKKDGYLVESVPEPENKEGMKSTLYYMPSEGFRYEYEEIVTLEDRRIKELENQVDALALEILKLQELA